jgi:hypothetical protein
MKNLTLLTLLLFAFNLSFSQELSTDSMVTGHSIGLNVGSSTGIGFSYKYVKSRHGIQLSGIPIYSDGDLWASFGGALTLRSKSAIANNKDFIPLIYAGMSMIAGNTSNSLRLEWASAAIGFGFEYKVTDRVVYTIMAGYGLYVGGDINTNLAGETGLHFRL